MVTLFILPIVLNYAGLAAANRQVQTAWLCSGLFA